MDVAVLEVESPLGILFVENGIPVPHDYVTTLTNYNMRTDSDFLKTLAEERVRKSVVDLLFDVPSDTSQRIGAFIRVNNDNLPDGRTEEAARIFIRNSVRVKTLEVYVPGIKALNPVYNIYMYPPTANTERLDRWREWTARLKFHAGPNGVGTRYQFRFKCIHCKSIDHPSGLCPHTRAHRGRTQGPAGGDDDDDELLPMGPDPGPGGSKQNPHNPGPGPKGSTSKGKGKAPGAVRQGKGGTPGTRALASEPKKRRIN